MNRYYRLVDTLTPADLQAAARKYLVDDSMVVTTLSHEALPAGIETLPKLASMARPAGDAKFDVLVQKIGAAADPLQAAVRAGSAHDPAGKEGLAALTAAMVASRRLERAQDRRGDQGPVPDGRQLQRAGRQGNDHLHRHHPQGQLEPVPRHRPAELLSPGFREEDFRRLKDAQKNALLLDLKDNNEEEFGKERLQTNVFAGTPYGHPVLGTVKGIESITLDDVKAFYRQAYTQGALHVGISGDVSDAMTAR
jgi:zinc protease